MKTRLFILLTLTLIIVSCSSWRATLVSKGDINDAIRNAIMDFMHTCYLHKKDSIFPVNVYIENDSLVGLSISGYSENKICPGPNPAKLVGGYSLLPNQYLIYDKKLFYWDDSTMQITEEIFDVLKRYDHIDSTNYDSLGYIPLYIIREYAKGAHYYFCKNNLKIYKKVVTNKAMEWYTPPKLNCNKCKR